jgi:hypothetical protein
MERSLYSAIFVMLGAVLGKTCQYTSVAYLGPQFGFACASLVGLIPFLAALLFLKTKYPRYFDFRGRSR